ncbi:MAG: EscU/YscU/HrcU family type III secretion system export apparatus switch protein [Leptospiraceae bacterium]|nr:EscU/YscU/HrcU family type III secretion system export apparatus switch protein [Leptospiraceae bacterium]
MQNPDTPSERHPDTAAALQFEESRDRAPRLTAKGEGELARQMVELARMHGIEVIRDPSLAEFLKGLRTGSEIPENLYRAVSRIFAFLYSKQGHSR